MEEAPHAGGLRLLKRRRPSARMQILTAFDHQEPAPPPLPHNPTHVASRVWLRLKRTLLELQSVSGGGRAAI